MKTTVLKGAILSCCISMLFACGTKQEKQTEAPVIDKEAIKAEIQAKENEFANVYNSGKLTSIGYYADDAITYFQNRAPLTSKEERIAFFESDIQNNPNTISFTTKDVFISNDGMQVVEIGAFSVVDSVNTTVNSGNYMSLFEKRDGKYVCLRDMSASDMVLE